MESKLRLFLIKYLALSEHDVASLIARAPHSYKKFQIPKKNGGLRAISQPAGEIKTIQHCLIDFIFINFKVHPAATAYEKKSSIKINAELHSKNDYFLKLDFKDFFTSITYKDIVSFLVNTNLKLSEEDIKDLARLVCTKNASEMCLSIGAPSSPKISNIILYAFDEELYSWCTDNKIVYTRYADDMTFSTKIKNMTPLIEAKVNSILDRIPYPKLTLNPKKRISLSKRQRTIITGINITSSNGISVGRSLKRHIKSKIYNHITKKEKLSQSDIEKLKGLVAYTDHIEPGFKKKIFLKLGIKDIV